MNKLANPILKDCVDAFKRARSSLFEGVALLYQIKENSLWEGQFDSYTAFLEEGCDIDRGYGSRILAAYEHFVVKGGVDQGQLNNIDPNKLYLAIPLIERDGAVQATESARLLSRAEIKDEVREEKFGECTEHTPITICSICHHRL